MKRKILIIGSEGNVGRWLVPYLSAQGHEIYCVDQRQMFKERYTVANVMSVGDLAPVFAVFQPDVVYLLAAMVSRVTCEMSPVLTVDTNLSGLNNVIQLCKTEQAKLMYFSTSEVYGNVEGKLSENGVCRPNNFYGLTKWLGEQLVQYECDVNGLNAVILRPFMFYDENETFGEHRSAMIRFAYSLYHREKIMVHKGSARSWTHMSDAVVILERLMNADSGSVVNVGSEGLLWTANLARMMCEELGLLYEDYVEEIEQPSGMTLVKDPDLTRQTTITKYTPQISIQEGIKIVLNRVKQRC